MVRNANFGRFYNTNYFLLYQKKKKGISAHIQDFKMYTLVVTLFLLILPKCLTLGPLECSDCFYQAKCFCTGEHTLIHPSMEECNEISCLNDDMKTIRSFCKDTEGQCLGSKEFAFGTYNFRCVKLYCQIKGDEGGTLLYDQVCRVDKNFAEGDYAVYENRFEC
ncbi:uncharacterized protein LOC128248058 [Octopus bimaculoides]|uniref:uncharacterized protein LOC128248058 n=1 Tax=Octopus bimaculoides TaxID=37653 RepID=UPI0022E640BC|nr:uncharacterized protein LOC128248058 [Octopus bimaculoides]